MAKHESMLLAIYLNDHLGGSTAGRELARRAASSNRGSGYGQFLAELAVQIDEDRNSLIEIMSALDVRVDHIKVIGGWAAEKLGRLKLNGRLVGYSPLSRVVELEGLLLGVNGKLALWTSLQALEPEHPGLDASSIRELASRAEVQLTGLQEHRLRAVSDAFG